MGSTKHIISNTITSPYSEVPIVLIGAGGTGSQVISGLARMNYALKKLGHHGIHIHLIDGDAVSESNVGRQIFSVSDIGRNKAETLISRINTFYGFNWKAYPMIFDRVMSMSDSRMHPSFIITAVDSPESRIEVGNSLKGSSIMYWMDTGNKTSSGNVILGTPGKKGVEQPSKVTISKLPTVLDLYPDIKKHAGKNQGPSCSVEEALSRQDLFVNNWVSMCALEILWKIFRKGYITEHGAFFDLKTMTVRPLPVDVEVWKRMGWQVDKAKKKRKAGKKLKEVA